MSQAVLSPNLTKKFQWEVSQIANKERSLAPLYRWFKCKLKPPKKALFNKNFKYELMFSNYYLWNILNLVIISVYFYHIQ